MFGTLESNWDHSAHRGWRTLASFTMQTLALSLLLAVSLIWVGGPPQVRWLGISAPASFTPAAPTPVMRDHHPSRPDAVPRRQWIVAPSSIPEYIAPLNDAGTSSITDAPSLDFGQGPGKGSSIGISRSIGDRFPMVVPPRPYPVKPLLVSHLAEANLLNKVQPAYPALARQARIQGTVEL